MLSGRLAFSGCRGRAAMSMSVTMIVLTGPGV
jgi:hypothetical protein